MLMHVTATVRILRRLCALGWDKEINYLKHHGEYGAMDRTYGLPILRESGNLTPKGMPPPLTSAIFDGRLAP